MAYRGVQWRHYLAWKWDGIKYSHFRLHALRLEFNIGLYICNNHKTNFQLRVFADSLFAGIHFHHTLN